MTDEEIYAKIEGIYNTEKGKPFIAHLVRSFLPTFRSTFMLENNKKKIMRCAITGTLLISKTELVTFQIANSEEIFKNMTQRLLGETSENIVVDKFKGKMIAVECDKSERVLCLPAVQQLFNFASSEYLKGNKHIGFLLKDERKKAFGNTENNSETTNTQTEKYQKKFGSNQVNNDSSKHTSQKTSTKTLLKSTTSLADSDVLQNLKKQLEDGGE